MATLLLVCAMSASCASSSGGSRIHVKAPELLTTVRPELVTTGVTTNATRPTTIVEIQVVVNTTGKADLSTLKISGPGAEVNRNAVTTWVQEARFKPGLQDGQPVSALFRQSFTAMTRTVRTR
jgi:hypothetical protein